MKVVEQRVLIPPESSSRQMLIRQKVKGLCFELLAPEMSKLRTLELGVLK